MKKNSKDPRLVFLQDFLVFCCHFFFFSFLFWAGKALSKFENHAGCYIDNAGLSTLWKRRSAPTYSLEPEHPQKCSGDWTFHLSGLTALVRRRVIDVTHHGWGVMGAELWEVPEQPAAFRHLAGGRCPFHTGRELTKWLAGSFYSVQCQPAHTLPWYYSSVTEQKNI